MNSIHYHGDLKHNYISHILKELYIEKVYEPYLTGKSDLTMVDMGAHIGLFTSYALPHAKKIYCFEPDANNFEALTKNKKSNGWKNVHLHRKAITGSGKPIRLYHSSNPTAHTIVRGDENDSELVQSWTISDFFEQTGEKWVDFIKLDIEGAEFEVLCGLHFEKHSDKIGMIIGEMHDWAGRNYNQLKWSLVDNGFKVKFLEHDASIFVARRAK